MSNRAKRRAEREQEIAERKKQKAQKKAEAVVAGQQPAPEPVPEVPAIPATPKKYRTLNNHFLVKRLDMNDERTAGGLIKPEIARQRSQRGEIRFAPIGETECPIGTIVIFTKYGGSDVEINGEKLMLVQRLQLYAIEEEDLEAIVALEASKVEEPAAA